jgi:hypothetical protein
VWTESSFSAEKAGLFGLPSGWVRVAYPESGYTTRRTPEGFPKNTGVEQEEIKEIYRIPKKKPGWLPRRGLIKMSNLPK